MFTRLTFNYDTDILTYFRHRGMRSIAAKCLFVVLCIILLLSSTSWSFTYAGFIETTQYGMINNPDLPFDERVGMGAEKKAKLASVVNWLFGSGGLMVSDGNVFWIAMIESLIVPCW